MAETTLVVPAHSEYIARGCPTCHFGIEEKQTIVLCGVCKTAHHEKCWYEKGGCGKLGCRGVASRRADDVGKFEAKTGSGPDALKPVSDPRKSQLPLPIVLGVGIVIIIIAYYLFVR